MPWGGALHACAGHRSCCACQPCAALFELEQLWQELTLDLHATGAGVYNEEVFASLDWVIDQAAQRNLKLIIPIEVS